jgi:transcriptional regulator with XRE-family HTH domain
VLSIGKAVRQRLKGNMRMALCAMAVQRKRRGINQPELAKMIGVEQETISRFERGATLPPLSRLNDMADALSCPIEDLIREGSTRLEDTVQALAQTMAGLSDDDRKLVIQLVIQLCSRLKKDKKK